MRSRPGVLVVDDSPTTCRFIATTLEQAGYDVEIAYTGRAGLAKMAHFQPMCLILDVLLPDISGYALCRSLQQMAIGRTMYIILISSKNEPLDRVYGLRQGADLYLPKPFTAEELVRSVWEGLPPPFRSVVLPSLSSPQPGASPPLAALIPHRVADEGMMRTGNPFALAPAIADKQARELYAAIDGKRTVAELATIVGLDTEAVNGALRLLLNEHHIQLYDAEGRRVQNAL